MSIDNYSIPEIQEPSLGISSGQVCETFNEPWQAQAFALTLALYRAGLFSWSEWTSTLGEEIKKAQAQGDPDLGNTYYYHWLAALESLVQKKGLATYDLLTHYKEAWRQAAQHTPHGEPIILPSE